MFGSDKLQITRNVSWTGRVSLMRRNGRDSSRHVYIDMKVKVPFHDIIRIGRRSLDIFQIKSIPNNIQEGPRRKVDGSGPCMTVEFMLLAQPCNMMRSQQCR